ncbi:MAG: 3-deoxy-7-phosphoheptulonate synthase [Armatimonadetes bacterium]|nr:3-deoxy-7-phosphoheptulonate synthase [Armatimonadota bacterium]
MIVVMREKASVKNLGAVIGRIEDASGRAHISRDADRTILGVVGVGKSLIETLVEMEGVERVTPLETPYKLASREFQPSSSTVTIGGIAVGGPEFVVMAGPCAVESLDQTLEAAHAVKRAGAHMLRGGAFKPRTSPYSFQGLGEKGLEILAVARKATGLPVVTEVMAVQDIPMVARYADVLQVGARNMQNFNLLQELGKARKPVLLKRGLMSSLEEFLMSAEYILSHGNSQVILCERGIRTFERMTRNTLDISAVPVLKKRTHLPIMVDPSHAAGEWDLVPSLSRAALAAGADGLIIEVHPRPSEALSDGPQALKPETFMGLMNELRAISAAMGRSMAPVKELVGAIIDRPGRDS